jgi:hypothetical protein
MIDKIYFLYCSLIAFSGFTIGFYGIMARHKIELETKKGLKKGFDFDTDEGNTYFAEKFENWRSGSFFDSQIAPSIGVFVALSGFCINMIYNSFWNSLFLIIISYTAYLIIVNILKWYIQIVSILTLLVSIVFISLKLT